MLSRVIFQILRVRIYSYKVNTSHTRCNHPVYGIASSTAIWRSNASGKSTTAASHASSPRVAATPLSIDRTPPARARRLVCVRHTAGAAPAAGVGAGAGGGGGFRGT